MGMTLAELARLVQGEVRGDPSFVVERANSLEQAGPRDIAFVASARNAERIADTRAGSLILGADVAPRFAGNAIVVTNPALAFALVSAQLHPMPPLRPGVHATATVDPSARIAVSAEIGPGTNIDADAVIEDNVFIGPGCVVGRGASIGANSRLIARVVVLDRCLIGRRCLLQPGAVIGGEGFGFARDGSRWVKQPQIGRVVIGDDVEVGANTTIDRGTFGDTVIGNGVKLDNLIHIAHNVRIGDETAIAACVGIAGSTIVGKRCTIAGQAGIIDHVEIADDVHITAATAVMSSLPQPGVYSSGLPAEPATQWRRAVVRLGQLDDLARRLRQLEEKIKRLTED